MRYGIAVVVLGWAVCARAEVRSPNVVVLYADDMGIGDVGCYGCRDIRTPNIDSLARDGVRFTHYYSAAPVCSASRAGLLTGRYPIRAGVPANVSSQPGDAGMPTSEVTIAELAKARGYATALVGKWHLGFSNDTQPNAQGFDFFFGHHAGCIDYYSHMFYWQDPPHHDLYRNRVEVREEGQYMTDLVAREAVRFIEGNSDKPFLLYVAFNAPHYPMQAPERYRRMYEKLAPQRAIYAAMVTCMDDAIGRILETLRARGLERDTIVFFASDNGATTEMRANGGGGSNGPYRGHKFSLFEGGIRMPAVIRWPAVAAAGEVREPLAMGIDLLPTLAQAIDAPLPADRIIDGRSWLPMLKDASQVGHDTLFWAFQTQEAVRDGRWKLVRSVGNGAASRRAAVGNDDLPFLADVEADPSESRNVASGHPDVVEGLGRRLGEWRASLGGRDDQREGASNDAQSRRKHAR